VKGKGRGLCGYPAFAVLVLTIIQGPDKGRIFELPDHEPQLLGRSSEALPLTDNTVSRRHAELTPDAGMWFVRDLGSQNGTWVNGVRIGERTSLKPGDQIRAGATLMIFGRSAGAPGGGKVRIARSEPGQSDATVERTLPSNEDSVILASPEPRSTAAADHLRIIYRLTTLTTQIPDRAQLLEGVMDLVFSEFKPERGCIMLTDSPPAGGGGRALSGEDAVAKPRPAVVRYHDDVHGSRAGAAGDELVIPRSILHHAIVKGEGLLCSSGDPGAAGKFSPGDSVVRLNIRSAVCSPVRFRDRTFGAIYIDTSVPGSAYSADQLALLNAIGQHTGLALANAELYSQKLQAERLAAMGETVASLSHSIKNILQGLRGGGDVVEMGLKKEDLKVARGGWSILKRNLDRIIGLTMNMLAYSRPRTLDMELTRVGVLLEDCASLLTDRCTAKGIALIVDADPEMPPVAMDAGLMHQALMNLMVNAVEAVESQSGTVTVRAVFRPAPTPGAAGEVQIDVIDNGPGIAPEMQQRIFEPFFTTKGLRGTGLGLAVTRRIIEQHAGRVSLKSALGRGATFTIVIPTEPGQLIDPSQTSASRDHAGPAMRPLDRFSI
jgi:two-component system NtrC family sensor kinase